MAGKYDGGQYRGDFADALTAWKRTAEYGRTHVADLMHSGQQTEYADLRATARTLQRLMLQISAAFMEARYSSIPAFIREIEQEHGATYDLWRDSLGAKDTDEYINQRPVADAFFRGLEDVTNELDDAQRSLAHSREKGLV